MARFRQLKTQVLDLLGSPQWRERLAELADIPGEQLAGPLFTALLDRDEDVRWRAVVAFGKVLERLADARPEAARTIMRRIIWSLNEESGNIAWFAPQAFGEILAGHPLLAREYHRLLLSYVREHAACDDNYLELCALRRGAWWGVARLAQARPELAEPALPDLIRALDDADPETRGLAALALGRLADRPGADAALSRLRALAADDASFRLWRDDRVQTASVGALAEEAARLLAPPQA